MKTLNIFLNTIYCAEVVQSCITFQHNHRNVKEREYFEDLHKDGRIILNTDL